MADPVVHITAGLPDSGTGNITTLGQTLLDGANITTGAIADAAVAAGAAGSLSGKLRAISRDVVLTKGAGASDGTTARVTIDSGQVGTLGPAVKASSISVTRATDEGSLPTKDDGPNWTTVWGIVGVPFTSADQHSAAASVTDAPTSGQKIVVDDLIFSTDTAMNVTFKCETSGTVVTGPFYVPANFAGQLTTRSKGWKLATADKKLQVITSVAGNIMVHVGYHSEA
jgi:hypothetical protein